jgi:hypothetical protein
MFGDIIIERRAGAPAATGVAGAAPRPEEL